MNYLELLIFHVQGMGLKISGFSLRCRYQRGRICVLLNFHSIDGYPRYRKIVGCCMVAARVDERVGAKSSSR